VRIARARGTGSCRSRRFSPGEKVNDPAASFGLISRYHRSRGARGSRGESRTDELPRNCARRAGTRRRHSTCPTSLNASRSRRIRQIPPELRRISPIHPPRYSLLAALILPRSRQRAFIPVAADRASPPPKSLLNTRCWIVAIRDVRAETCAVSIVFPLPPSLPPPRDMHPAAAAAAGGRGGGGIPPRHEDGI
jgi:hypothetical protein